MLNNAMTMNNYFCLLTIAALWLVGCGGEAYHTDGFVQVDGTLLRDSLGRSLILRGLNYVNKDKENRHRNLIGDTAFQEMKSWGYNSVRLGVNWAELQPTPHRYDTTYLHDLDDRLTYAEQHGLYVILDMHQDLYGERFGGGAPEWATLDDGLPHATGGTWSDAYFISPAVQRSFDNFWANKPAEDGVGVQDHYVNAWKMLAQRYRNNKTVVGFDVMNEPFIGSNIQAVLGVMLGAMTDYLNQKGATYTAEQVGEMWMDSRGKERILSELQDSAIFVDVLDKMEPIYREFEEQELMPFYTKLAVAVRAVNTHHILFWEPSVSSNNGIPTHLSPVPEAGSQQGYMPHFYDIVLDTDLAGKADNKRLSAMFDRLEQSAGRLQLPTIIGEWGAFYGGDTAVVDAARTMVAGIDRLLVGDMYWDYFRGMEQQAYFSQALQRPYVACTVGKLNQQHLSENEFSFRWEEDGSRRAETWVYLPTINDLRIMGLDEAEYHLKPLVKSAAWLAIKPLGKKTKRSITITWKNSPSPR